MHKLIFIGTNYKKANGGVASVLQEYAKIYPDATFISTTVSQGIVINGMTLIAGIIKLMFYLIKYPKAIVHIHGSSYKSFFRKYFLFKIIQIFNNKIIYHIHGGEFPLFFQNESLTNKNKIRDFVNNVDCVVCLSVQFLRYFNENFEPKKIMVIPNIVAFPKNKKRIKSKYFNFLFLGKITEQKGLWLLLDVLSELKEETIGRFKFLIGGIGEVDKLNNIIKDKRLEKVVNYIGWISNVKKEDYLRNADAYILPSFNEGLPVSILEAMTYSLPIISTNVGGISEVVKNHINGLLIAPDNRDELKKSIEFVIDNESDFFSYGLESLNLVQPYLPNEVKKKLDELYNQI